VIIGMSLSFMVLRWLGKSFSIMAEARRLVTGGPYAIVRHPLYICEEIAIIGILLQAMSPLAVLIVLAHALIQFRRMLNEEKVLRATFPDYDDYATRTPRLIPAWQVWPFSYREREANYQLVQNPVRHSRARVRRPNRNP